jgi:hypothetical protein
VRTWSRHAETPVLQNNFSWDTLSAATGITFHNFYTQRYKGTVIWAYWKQHALPKVCPKDY